MSSIRKILIIGSFAKGALEHQFVRGLKQAGWLISTFDIQKPVKEKRNSSVINKIFLKTLPGVFLKEINSEVLQAAERLKPDVILVFKGMELFPGTISNLKNYTGLLINYNPDHPFEFYSPGAGNSYVKESIPFYGLHLSYSTNIVRRLRQEYNVRAECIPFGYDETLAPKPSNTMLKNRFIFIGAWDSERAAFFDELDSGISIYGPSEWFTRTSKQPNTRSSYRNKELYDQEYINASYSAAGCLNLLRKQNLVECSHNMRTFEVCGYGGLLISQRTEEQQSFFEEDKEAIFFDTIEELKDKLSFLKKHPDLIESIKSKAKLRCLTSGYSYLDRTAQLMKFID
jgi:spore maturation protein CgeB